MKKNIRSKVNKIPLYVLVVFIVLLGTVVYAQTTYLVAGINGNAYEVPGGQTITVTGPDGICVSVKNRSTSPLFVPINSETEWTDFLNNGSVAAQIGAQQSIPVPNASTFTDSGGPGNAGHVLTWGESSGTANSCYANSPIDMQYEATGSCVEGNSGCPSGSWCGGAQLNKAALGTWVDLGPSSGYGGSDDCQCRYSVRVRTGPINGQYSAWGPTYSWTTGSLNSSLNGCNVGASS